MNCLKIQHDILKSAYDRDLKNKNFDWNYRENDEAVIMGDRCVLYIIPKHYVFLDVKKTFDRPPCEYFENITKMSENVHSIADTGIEKPSDIGFKIHVFDCGDGEELWIKKDFLKMFDLKNSTFKGKNRKSPLFIYEDDVLVGTIAGVNHK